MSILVYYISVYIEFLKLKYFLKHFTAKLLWQVTLYDLLLEEPETKKKH